MAALLPEGQIDTVGVFDSLAAVPAQLQAALDVGIDVDTGVAPADEPVAGIVLVAAGADTDVAEAAQALVGPHSPVPVIVHRHHGLPGFVSDAWRCVFIAQDATAEERDALARTSVDRAHVTAVGSGDLIQSAADAGAYTVALDFGVPAPRFAFAGTLVATLRLLERYGAISAPLGSGDVASLTIGAMAQIRARFAELVDGGVAATLARRIGRTLPLIYGTGQLGAVAATRWKHQVNDNAKVAAFSNAVPELVHHELSGWGQHGDMTRQVFTLITLRHDFEHAGETAVMPAVETLVDEVVAGRHEIRAAGAGVLAQFLDLTFTGDVTSYYLAQANEIDPGPTSTEELIRRHA